MGKILRMTLMAAAFAMSASAQAAGSFVTLPDYDPTAAPTSLNPVNTVVKLTKSGAANNAADPLFLGSFTTGADVYRKVPANLTLLASNTTTVLPFTNAAGTSLATMGSFYDAVYRDTSDNALVFASRLELLPTSGVEINDIFRKGFSSFNVTDGASVAVAWSAATSADFRLRSATRSAQGLLKIFNPVTGVQTGVAPRTYNDDVIDLSTDTSAPESNPVSGWYFVKVRDPAANATDHVLGYSLTAGAVGLYRGNDEPNGAVTTLWISGYAPTITSVVAPPVPEPAEYALFLAGLGVLALVARRRLPGR